MKKTIVISLSILILSLTSKDLITYAQFFINKDFISKNICINRDNPKMKCQGKCFLKKSIQKKQKREKNFPNSNKKKNSKISYVSKSKVFNCNDCFTLKKKSEISYNPVGYFFSYHERIFRPPQLRIG